MRLFSFCWERPNVMANHLFSLSFLGPLWILIHFWSRCNFGRPRARLVHVFKNWKLLFENICGNTCGWKNVLKCVKCCLKTENGCLKTQTKHPPNFRVFGCVRVGGGEGCQGHYKNFCTRGVGVGVNPMIGSSLTAIPYQFTTSFLFLKIDHSNILPKDTFDPLSLAAQTCCLVCNMVTIITWSHF